MLEVLKRDTIPVWAASLEMSARLTDLRLAYSTFINIEATIKDIITQLSATDPHSGTGGMQSTIMNLKIQD